MITLVYMLLLTTLHLFHEKIYYLKDPNHIENKTVTKIKCEGNVQFSKIYLRILAQM